MYTLCLHNVYTVYTRSVHHSPSYDVTAFIINICTYTLYIYIRDMIM